MADVFKREDVEKLFAKGASDEWGEMREGRTILMVNMHTHSTLSPVFLITTLDDFLEHLHFRPYQFNTLEAEILVACPA